jgi:hypothetical protein
MSLPTIRQTYDPEELFVELSRLPPNLIDIDACKQFLLPVVPLEVRTVNNNEVHIVTVIYCSSQSDANSVLQRDGEAGIKIRWSGRGAFYALPQSKQPFAASLNPQVWDFPANDQQPFNKRSSDQHYQSDIDVKRPKNDLSQNDLHSNQPIFSQRPEASWANSITHPTQSESSIFYVLLMNVPFKASNWDVTAFANEAKVNPLKITRVFSPNTERSDKWMLECQTRMDANNIIESHAKMFGRQLR